VVVESSARPFARSCAREAILFIPGAVDDRDAG